MERHTHTVRKSSIFTNIFKLWIEFFLIINTHKFCYLKKENVIKKVNLNALREAGEKFCNGGDKKKEQIVHFCCRVAYIPLALI